MSNDHYSTTDFKVLQFYKNVTPALPESALTIIFKE